VTDWSCDSAGIKAGQTAAGGVFSLLMDTHATEQRCKAASRNAAESCISWGLTQLIPPRPPRAPPSAPPCTKSEHSLLCCPTPLLPLPPPSPPLSPPARHQADTMMLQRAGRLADDEGGVDMALLCNA